MLFDFFGTRETVCSLIRQQRDLERRVKRLELMAAKEAESKLASLKDEKMGTYYVCGLRSIEELVRSTEDALELKSSVPLKKGRKQEGKNP